MQANVNLGDLIPVKCRLCGNDQFDQVIKRFILPSTHKDNPTKRAQLVALPMFRCTQCGDVTDDPTTMREYMNSTGGAADDRHNNDSNKKTGNPKPNPVIV